MRSRKALLNTLTGLIYEAVTIICGLILPRLILSCFGSSYNGIISSITQFLSAVALLKAGIGGVTRAALYKPLAKKDTEEISKVIKTTEYFLHRIAIIFCGLTLAMACFYPLLVQNEFDWFFSFSLIIILSISTFAQYFFGLAYQMLLQSDQRQCVIYIVQIFTTIANTIIAAALILTGCSIHIVKLGSAVVYTLNPLIINIYTKKKYKIRSDVEMNNDLMGQRWDAFGQELAYFVHNNTDLIVLTVFTNLYEVSVYTVYNYVIKGIREVVVMFITGFDAAFGDMLAKKQMKLVEENLRIYELIVFSLVSVIYSVTAVMIVPYASLYTKGITDVNYVRPLFAILMVVSGAFSCYRIPYKTITDAVGHFKQTRNGALVEAALNITISVLTVKKLGLVGVALGTVVATIFRSLQYAVYLSKNIAPRSIWIFVKHVLLSFGTGIVVYIIATGFIRNQFNGNVTEWILCAMESTAISVLLTAGIDFIFYREDFYRAIKKLCGAVKIKEKKGKE